MRRLRATLVTACLACTAAPVAHAQVVGGRLIDDIGVASQPGYVAVTVLFGCTLRYVSHTPASGGEVLQVRLRAGPDCGNPVAPVLPPLTAEGREALRAVDVQRPFGDDVELVLAWNRREDFVLVPSLDGRGLRIRLLRPEADHAKVVVMESHGAASTFAVNLDSSRQPFPPGAIAAAAAATRVRVYVSEAVVDEERWYRLRAGPFVSEADARNVLAAAKSAYPKAWLAVADDEKMTTPGTPEAVGSVPPTPATAARATLGRDEIDRTLAEARDAFRHRDYATAIPLLTKLQEQPEFPGRADVQEMLGLARERNGQLAHAKAEYEEYLRRYPQGPAADRVRKRLRALALATSPATARRGPGGVDESPWQIYGGVSQIYRQDATSFSNGTTSGDARTQDALLNDAALVARRRGERYDFATRASAGYTLDMLQSGPGNQTRVSMLFAELNDRDLGWTVRGGRQGGSAGGLLGTFDGVYLGFQARPWLRLDTSLGYPVESTREAPTTDRRFVALAADFGTFANAWDFTLYAVTQQYSGATDRQAIGTELRYFRPGVTVIGLVDYDVHYQALNDALLLGTLGLPGRWTLNVSLDHRKSPSLTTRNALIGQPVSSFDELYGLYTPAEIEQLARDRTAQSDTVTLSLSRPLAERWQWSMDASSMSLTGTPASGGVPATPDPGTLLALTTQLMGYGLFGRGDMSSLGLQYQTGQSTETLSLGLNAQFPVGERWRLGPRLRVDQRRFQADGSDQLLYSPGLRTELRIGRFNLELEGGAEIGTRQVGSTSENTSRYYLSAGYRYDF